MSDVVFSSSGLPKARKPNFTESETMYILEQVFAYRDIVTSKCTDSITNVRKEQVWRKLTDGINAKNTHIKRSVGETKRRWKNMVCTARKEALRLKRIPPGSGHAQPIISDVSQKVLEINPKWREFPNSVINSTDTDNFPYMKVEIDLEDEDNKEDYSATSLSPNSNFTICGHGSNTADNASPPMASENERHVSMPSAVTSPVVSSGIILNSSAITPNMLHASESTAPQYGSEQRHRGSKRQRIDNSAFHLHQEIVDFDRENLSLEKERLKIEKEKIAMEKEQMAIERQKLNMEREKLTLEKEKNSMEKERLSLEINYWKRKLLQISHSYYNTDDD